MRVPAAALPRPFPLEDLAARAGAFLVQAFVFFGFPRATLLELGHSADDFEVMLRWDCVPLRLQLSFFAAVEVTGKRWHDGESDCSISARRFCASFSTAGSRS